MRQPIDNHPPQAHPATDPGAPARRSALPLPDGATHALLTNPHGFVLAFPYEPAVVSRVKGIPGRRWHPDHRAWQVPATPASVRALRALLAEDPRFVATRAAQERLDAIGHSPEPASAPGATRGLVRRQGRRLVLEFDYEPTLVDQIKTIDGRRYDRETHAWSVPLSPNSVPALLAILDAYPLTVDPPARAELDRLAVVARRGRHAVESAAALGAVQAAGVEDLDLPLYGFQRDGVRYALTHRRALIGDEPGLGKTLSALAAIELAGAYPALVVCPASMKLTWEAEVAKWLPQRKVAVLSGTAPDPDRLRGVDLIVLNYDIVTAWQRDLGALRAKALVVDESHLVKEPRAKRSRAIAALAARTPAEGLVLFLSGTPMVNRPRELIHQLRVLDRLDAFGGAHGFRERYCDLHHNGFGMDDGGSSNLQELGERLREVCMVRRRKADVLRELPAKTYAAVPLALTNRAAYRRAEADVVSFLGSLAADAVRNRGGGEDQAARAAFWTEQRALRAKALVKIGALRQLAAQGKLRGVIEWTQTFLAGDEKLVLFAHHRDIQEQLIAAFPDAARIVGDQAAGERHQNVERFQGEPDCRLAVCSIDAAGVGLTLTAASNVAFCELPWTPAALTQAEDRLHRISQERPVTVWHLLAPQTIDERMHRLLEHKRAVVTAAVGDQEGAGTIAGELLGELAGIE